MTFPVDLLAVVDPEFLEQSAKEYISELLHRTPEIPEHLRLPDSTRVNIGLCNVSYVPLYGVDTTKKILALFSLEDNSRVVGLYLLGQWWSVEDILKTADPSRTGLVRVQTPGERIVLYVLNRIIYRTKEKAIDDTLFLCHGEHEVAKILWKDGEAIGFYSVKPEGTLCSNFLTQCYQLPVMDTIFVRKSHRGNGYGLQMLEDFVRTFKKDALGLKYPLSMAMYKVCKKYISLHPEDKEVLCEVESVGGPFQRTQIANKLNALEADQQIVTRLNFEDNDVPNNVQEKTMEYTEIVEEIVQIKITKEVQDVPITTCAKSSELKRRRLRENTGESTEKIIRTEDADVRIQSAVDEPMNNDENNSVNNSDLTRTQGVVNILDVTHQQTKRENQLTVEPTECVLDVLNKTMTESVVVVPEETLEKAEVLQMTPITEIPSLQGNEETHTVKSFEANIGPVDLQALELQEEVEVVKMITEIEEVKEKSEIIGNKDSKGEAEEYISEAVVDMDADEMRKNPSQQAKTHPKQVTGDERLQDTLTTEMKTVRRSAAAPQASCLHKLPQTARIPSSSEAAVTKQIFTQEIIIEEICQEGTKIQKESERENKGQIVVVPSVELVVAGEEDFLPELPRAEEQASLMLKEQNNDRVLPEPQEYFPRPADESETLEILQPQIDEKHLDITVTTYEDQEVKAAETDKADKVEDENILETENLACGAEEKDKNTEDEMIAGKVVVEENKTTVLELIVTDNEQTKQAQESACEMQEETTVQEQGQDDEEEKSGTLTEMANEEDSDMADNTDERQRSSYANTLRRSRRLMDEPAEGELIKRVLRSSTKLCKTTTKNVDVHHITDVKEQHEHGDKRKKMSQKEKIGSISVTAEGDYASLTTTLQDNIEEDMKEKNLELKTADDHDLKEAGDIMEEHKEQHEVTIEGAFLKEATDTPKDDEELEVIELHDAEVVKETELEVKGRLPTEEEEEQVTQLTLEENKKNNEEMQTSEEPSEKEHMYNEELVDAENDNVVMVEDKNDEGSHEETEGVVDDKKETGSSTAKMDEDEVPKSGVAEEDLMEVEQMEKAVTLEVPENQETENNDFSESGLVEDKKKSDDQTGLTEEDSYKTHTLDTTGTQADMQETKFLTSLRRSRRLQDQPVEIEMTTTPLSSSTKSTKATPQQDTRYKVQEHATDSAEDEEEGMMKLGDTEGEKMDKGSENVIIERDAENLIIGLEDTVEEENLMEKHDSEAESNAKELIKEASPCENNEDEKSYEKVTEEGKVTPDDSVQGDAATTLTFEVETSVIDSDFGEAVKSDEMEVDVKTQKQSSAESETGQEEEPATEMTPEKDSKEAAAMLKLQKASVVLVDINKATPKHTGDSETGKEASLNEACQEPEQPEATSEYREDSKAETSKDLYPQQSKAMTEQEKCEQDDETVLELQPEVEKMETESIKDTIKEDCDILITASKDNVEEEGDAKKDKGLDVERTGLVEEENKMDCCPQDESKVEEDISTQQLTEQDNVTTVCDTDVNDDETEKEHEQIGGESDEEEGKEQSTELTPEEQGQHADQSTSELKLKKVAVVLVDVSKGDETCTETANLHEEERLNKTSIAIVENVSAEMETEHPLSVNLKEKGQDVSADNTLNMNDEEEGDGMAQAKVDQAGDIPLENLTASETEELAEVNTDGHEKDQNDDQESMSTAQTDAIQEGLPEETALITRNLRRRTVMIKSQPQRKSRHLQKTEMHSDIIQTEAGEETDVSKVENNEVEAESNMTLASKVTSTGENMTVNDPSSELKNVVETEKLENILGEQEGLSTETEFKICDAKDGSEHEETRQMASEELVSVQVEAPAKDEENVSVEKSTEVEHENNQKKVSLEQDKAGQDKEKEMAETSAHVVEEIMQAEMKTSEVEESEESMTKGMTKPGQETTEEESSDEEEAPVITRYLRQRTITVKTPLQKRSKHLCNQVVEIQKGDKKGEQEDKSQNEVSNKDKAIEMTKQASTDMEERSEIRITECYLIDSEDVEGVSVAKREEVILEQQENKDIAESNAENVSEVADGGKDMGDESAEDKGTKRAAEGGINEISVYDTGLIEDILEKNDCDKLETDKESSTKIVEEHVQQEKVLEKEEQQLPIEESEGEPRVAEEPLEETEDMGKLSTTEEILDVEKEDIGVEKRALRKRTICIKTPTGRTSKRFRKQDGDKKPQQAGVEHEEDLVHVEEPAVEQSNLEPRPENESTHQADDKMEDGSGMGEEMLQQAQVQKSPDGKETNEKTNEEDKEASKQAEMRDAINVSEDKPAIVVSQKEVGENENKENTEKENTIQHEDKNTDKGDGVEGNKETQQETVQNENKAEENTESLDENFSLELDEEDEIAFREHSENCSTTAENREECQDHTVEGEEESTLNRKGVLQQSSSATAEQSSTSHMLQKNDVERVEDKSVTGAVKEITEREKAQEKRKAIVELTPRRSKRLARLNIL